MYTGHIRGIIRYMKNENKNDQLFMDLLVERVFKELGGDVNKPYASAINLLQQKDILIEKQDKQISLLNFPKSFEKDFLMNLKTFFRSSLRQKQRKFMILLSDLKPKTRSELRKELGRETVIPALKRDALAKLKSKYSDINRYIKVIYLTKVHAYKMEVLFSEIKKQLVEKQLQSSQQSF